MNLDGMKDKLGDATFTELSQYIETLTAQRDAAKRESIEGRKTLKSKVEELTTAQERVFEKLGISSLDDLDNLPEPKGQAEATKQFEAKLKKLEREIGEKSKSFSELESRYKESTLSAAMEKALSGHEWIDRDIAAMLLKNGAQFEGDEILYSAGDKMLSLADGVKHIAATKPHLLKAAGAGGSGYKPSAGSAGGTKQMSRAEFESLSPQSQMEASKAGIQLT